MAKKKKRIPKRYRIAAYLLLLFVCIIVLLVFMPISSKKINSIVIDSLKRATGADIQVDKTTVFLLRGFRLKNFSLTRINQEKPIIQSSTVFIKINLLSYLFGKEIFDRFYFYNMMLDISSEENEKYIDRLISEKPTSKSAINIRDVQISNLKLSLPKTHYSDYIQKIQFKYIYMKVPTEGDIEFVIKGAKNNIFQNCFGKVLYPRDFKNSKSSIKAYLTLKGVHFDKVRLQNNYFYFHNNNIQLNTSIRYISDSYVINAKYDIDDLQISDDFRSVDFRNFSVDSEFLYTEGKLLQITDFKLTLDELENSVKGIIYLTDKETFSLDIDFKNLSPDIFKKLTLFSPANISDDSFRTGKIDGFAKLSGDLLSQGIKIESADVSLKGVSTYINEWDSLIQKIYGRIKYDSKKLTFLTPFKFEINDSPTIISGRIENFDFNLPESNRIILHLKSEGVLDNEILEKFLSSDLKKNLKGTIVNVPLKIEGDLDFIPEEFSKGYFDFEVKLNGHQGSIDLFNLPLKIKDADLHLTRNILSVNELAVELKDAFINIKGRIDSDKFIAIKPHYNLQLNGKVEPLQIIETLNPELADTMNFLNDVGCGFDLNIKNFKEAIDIIEYTGQVKLNKENSELEPLALDIAGQLNFPFYFASIYTEITSTISDILAIDLVKDFNIDGMLKISAQIKSNTKDDISYILGTRLPFHLEADIDAENFGIKPYFLKFRLKDLNGDFKYDKGEITATNAEVNAGNSRDCVVSGKADLREKVEINLIVKTPYAVIDDWLEPQSKSKSIGKFIPSILNAHIEAKEMRYKNYIGNNVDGEITFLNEFRGIENYFFDNVTLKLAEGKVNGEGIYLYDRNREDRIFANFEVSEMNLGTFIRKYINETSKVEGRFACATGFVVESSKEQYSVNGDGSLAIIDCFFTGVPIISALAQKSGVNELNKAIFTDVTADFKIQGNEIRTTNLKMRSNTIGISGHGALNLNGILDFTLGLSFSKGFLGKIPVVKEITKPIDKVSELLLLYKAKGTLKEPDISTVPLPPIAESGKAVYKEMLKNFKKLGVKSNKNKN